jgi:hypothetical protein
MLGWVRDDIVVDMICNLWSGRLNRNNAQTLVTSFGSVRLLEKCEIIKEIKIEISCLVT